MRKVLRLEDTLYTSLTFATSCNAMQFTPLAVISKHCNVLGCKHYRMYVRCGPPPLQCLAMFAMTTAWGGAICGMSKGRGAINAQALMPKMGDRVSCGFVRLAVHARYGRLPEHTPHASAWEGTNVRASTPLITEGCRLRFVDARNCINRAFSFSALRPRH